MTNEEIVEIDITGDGGLLKKIIKEGTGTETPLSGDSVQVHYTGRFEDGNVFDSSKERNTPFEFVLGRGSVIKGWDVGVETMKKGESAYLTCKPQYAYGENGSPPTIPANATLVFEVELLDWKMEDLSPEKDGGVQRRILEKGDGYIYPKDGAAIQVHLIGKLDGKVFEDRELEFALGDGCDNGIVEGLEVALRSFKKGEKSLVKLTPKYAYGSTGNEALNIPADAILDYEITLKNFEKVKEAWEMNSDEKIEESIIFKNKGTELFKLGKYTSAIKHYSKIINYLESDPGSEENPEARSLLLAGQLNLAACYLKTGEQLLAIKACDKVLEMEPTNVKGLFRRGQARMTLKDYEQARVDFQEVLKADPANKAAANQVILCNKNVKDQMMKEKLTYKDMFNKFAEQDKKKDAMRINTTESGVWQNGQRQEDNLGNESLNNNLGMENVELLPNNLTNP